MKILPLSIPGTHLPMSLYSVFHDECEIAVMTVDELSEQFIAQAWFVEQMQNMQNLTEKYFTRIVN